MKRQIGFSLIELIIVVAIIGILAAIIYPSYTEYVIKTNRIDAENEMVQVSRTLANYKISKGSYKDANLTTIYGSNTIPKQGSAKYDLILTISNDSNNWKLVASPKSGSMQDGNGDIILNSLGQKCWTKTTTACTPSNTSNW